MGQRAGENSLGHNSLGQNPLTPILSPFTLALMLAACGGGGGGGGSTGTTSSVPEKPKIPLGDFAGASNSVAGTPTTPQTGTVFFEINENTSLTASATTPNQRKINADLTSDAEVTATIMVRDAGNTRLTGNRNPFEIDAATGTVSFRAGAVLNYEQDASYKITVTLKKDEFGDTPVVFEVRLNNVQERDAVFALEGAAQVNDRLRITQTTADLDGPAHAITDGSPTYKWFRSADQTASTSADTEITGETGRGYTLTPSDHDHYIFAEVTYHDGTGEVRMILTGISGQIAPAPLLAAAASQTHTGEAGNGFHISYANSTAGVMVDLSDNAPESGGFATGDVLTSFLHVTGSRFADTLTGDSGVNILNGGGRDDILKGLAGADKLNGGAGSDTVSYANSNAGVTVDLSNSTAEVGGHAAGDVLSNIENFIGSEHNDTLIGDGNANIFTGGRGVDSFTGGGGDDIYVLDTRSTQGDDQVTDFRNSGNDKIRVDVDDPNAVTTLAELKTEGGFDIFVFPITQTQTNTLLQHPIVGGSAVYMTLVDFDTPLTLAMFDIV